MAVLLHHKGIDILLLADEYCDMILDDLHRHLKDSWYCHPPEQHHHRLCNASDLDIEIVAVRIK